MRTIVLMLVAALAAPGCGAAVARSSPADESSGIAVVSGTDGRLADSAAGRRRAPWIEVATSIEELVDLWEQFIPGAPPEAIDFTSSIIVFLLLGPQVTGGYAIEPVSVEIDGERAIVEAKLVQPMTPGDVTQVVTAPYAVVSVESRSIRKVEWINTDGRLAATKIIE